MQIETVFLDFKGIPFYHLNPQIKHKYGLMKAYLELVLGWGWLKMGYLGSR